MFVATGIGPYSGQAFHFRGVAPEPREYAQRRYDFEVRRHYAILDDRLAKNRYMLGDDYTIVDMAVWGWARLMPAVLGDNEAWAAYPNVKRWFDAINARPAAARATALRERHVFAPGLDDEAKKHMFRHILPA
jgi:GST-like protein